MSNQNVDIMKCAEQVGGSQFEMVLIAAVRAREIANKTRNKKGMQHNSALSEALQEIEAGKIGREYLHKM